MKTNISNLKLLMETMQVHIAHLESEIKRLYSRAQFNSPIFTADIALDLLHETDKHVGVAIS